MRTLLMSAVIIGALVAKTMIVALDNKNGSSKQGFTFIFVNYDRFRCESPSEVEGATYTKKIIHTIVTPRTVDNLFAVREDTKGVAANVAFIDRDENIFSKTSRLSQQDLYYYCEKVNSFKDRVVYSHQRMNLPMMLNGIVYNFDHIAFILYTDSDGGEFFIKLHEDNIWIATAPQHLANKPGILYSRNTEMNAHRGFGRFVGLSEKTNVVDSRSLQKHLNKGKKIKFTVDEDKAEELKLRIREETNGGFFAYVINHEKSIMFELHTPEVTAEIPFALYINDFLVQHGEFSSTDNNFIQDKNFVLDITCPLAYTMTETEMKNGKEFFIFKAYCRDPHRLV